MGPAFTPSTNAQESWHKTVKTYPGIGPLHRGADDLLEIVFPTMLQKDGKLRCDVVTVHPPDVLPAEYVAQAKELMDLEDKRAYHVHDGHFYVKYDWSTSEKASKIITDKWVREYERGLRGDIKPTTTMSVVVNHYLGLCKVFIPEDDAGDEDSEDMDYFCECDIYNLEPLRHLPSLHFCEDETRCA